MGAGEYQGIMFYIWNGVYIVLGLILFGLPIWGFFHYLYEDYRPLSALNALFGLLFWIGIFSGFYWLCVPLPAFMVTVSFVKFLLEEENKSKQS
jgi:hypothetical protein